MRKLKPDLLRQQNHVPKVFFLLLLFVLKTWFNHLHAHHRAEWPVQSPAVQHQAWGFIAGEVWRHVFFHCLQKCWPCTVSICQTKYINRLKKVTLESIHSQGFVLFLTWWHTKTSEIEQEGNQTALNKEEEKKKKSSCNVKSLKDASPLKTGKSNTSCEFTQNCLLASCIFLPLGPHRGYNNSALTQ